MNRTTTLIAVLSWACSLPLVAQADPLAGRDFLKFQQLPMAETFVDGAVFYGHDEQSTLYGSHAAGQYGIADPNGTSGPGHFVADDFADNYTADIVHVKFWGSYAQNNLGNAGVQKFLVSFESDVPAVVGNPFSYPGTPLLNQIIDRGVLSPQSGTFTETLVPTVGTPPENLYEYNAELKLPFRQVKDTVYWLKIVALVDRNLDGDPVQPIDWGWHTRDYTIQNTLASPVPSPGEAIVATTGGGTSVWHFQDDVISGTLNQVSVLQPGDNVLIDQVQASFVPLNYLVNVDIPTLSVPSPSMDLAFALYTTNPPPGQVPEPATLVSLLGLIGLAAAGRRLRRG